MFGIPKTNIKFEPINIDVKSIILMAIIIVMAIILTRIIRYFLNKMINRSSDKLDIDPTNFRFFKNAVSLIIYIIASIAVIYIIPSLRSLALTLFAGAGIFAAILGFASQQAFSNIISGIFIVIFRPFRVHDLITVGQHYEGFVEDITLRHTVIRNFEFRRVIMPNSLISNETVINSSIGEGIVRKFVEFKISFDADTDKAMKIMEEEALKHPKVADGRTKWDLEQGEPQIRVRLVGLGDYFQLLRAYVWVGDPDTAFEVHFQLNKQIKKRFAEEGIEIPTPYRTIVYKESATARQAS